GTAAVVASAVVLATLLLGALAELLLDPVTLGLQLLVALLVLGLVRLRIVVGGLALVKELLDLGLGIGGLLLQLLDRDEVVGGLLALPGRGTLGRFEGRLLRRHLGPVGVRLLQRLALVL